MLLLITVTFVLVNNFIHVNLSHGLNLHLAPSQVLAFPAVTPCLCKLINGNYVIHQLPFISGDSTAD